MPTDTKLYRFLLPLIGLLLILVLPQCENLINNDNEQQEPVAYNHQKAPGSSAHDLLSDSAFTAVQVEVDYMPGYRPTDDAITQLNNFLEQRLKKPSGVEISVSADPIPSQNQQTYSGEDIAAIEESERDYYSTNQGHTLNLYAVFVDGEFNQANVLGVAYFNTSMAFFGPTIHNNSGGIGEPNRSVLETTVFRHEIGHNMGLVNNGSQMQTDHQDDANGKHCTDDACLMYYAVETTDYIGNLTGGNVPALNQNCLHDIAANGGK
jgi:predicted Zn-dependent protease